MSYEQRNQSNVARPRVGHLLLYTLSHVEPSGNAPVRPGYSELTLQLATAACHVQRPNRNSLKKTGIGLQNYRVVLVSGMYYKNV
jgi:hypothetical protein